MSKSIYQKRLDNLKKTASNIGKKENTTQDKMNNQISNYQTRLGASGIDASKAIDKRNFIEKALNLPEDQNFLFDIFEIINRPQQALFGAIKNAQEGEDILEGARKGISGEEDYYFGDILRNMGVDDTPLFQNPLSGKDTSLADILGLGGDIFLDPVDIPLLAAKPVSEAGKVLKGADAADAARYAYKFDPLAAMTQKGSKSLLEAGVGGLAKGTKKLVKGGTKAAVNAADFRTVKKLAKESGLIADGTKITKDMMPDLVEGLGKLGVEVPLKSEALSNIGKELKGMFNYKGSVPADLYNTITRSDNAVDMASTYGRRLSEEAATHIDDYVKLTGKNADDVNNAVNMLISSRYKPETGMDYYVKTIKNGKSDIIKASKEQTADIKKAIEEFVQKTPNVTDDALKLVPVRGGFRLEGKQNLVKAIKNNDNMMKSLADIKFTKLNEFDDDIAKEIANLENIYKTEPEFKQLVDTLEPMYRDYGDFLSEVTEGRINFGDIVGREGYTRKSLTEEGQEVLSKLKSEGIDLGDKYATGDRIYEGSSKTFQGRTQSPVAEQAQRDFEKNLALRKAKEQNDLEGLKQLKDNYLETRRANIQKDLDEIGIKQAKATKNVKKNLSKLDISYQKQSGFVKKYNKELDDLNDLITDEVMKKATKVSNPKLLEGLSKSTDNYVKKVQALDSIKVKLANPNLTAKKIDTYQKQFDKAYEAVIKAKANIVTQTAKINGAVEESFIKEAGKLANKMSSKAAKSQEKLTKAEARAQSALDKIEQAKKSYNDIKLELQKQQSNLKLQLMEVERIADNPKELAKKIDSISKQIEQKERVISVLESAEGTKLYADGFTQGFDEFVNMSANETKALKNYNEVLMQAGLGNEDVIKFFKTGDKVKLSPNMVMMDDKFKEKTIKYLTDMKDIMPENSDLVKNFITELKTSKSAAIDKNVLDMLTLGSNAKRDANFILDGIDKVSNLFKKTSTVSPGTQVRNATGNAFNMWASGVPAKEIPKLYSRANKLSKSDYIVELVAKNAKGTLTAAEAADYKIIKQFIESGAMGKGKDIRDIGELIEKASKDGKSAKGLKKAWDKLFEVSGGANQWVDNRNRLALLSYASENPKYVAKLGVKDPIEAMHHVLFDPQNLSQFEKKYMKRLIPFYTFTKQNLMFQAKNIMTNTTKYNRLMKTFNKIYEGVGEGNYRQYQKENFEIPLWRTEKGNVTLKSNLPVSDLGEYIENPLQRLVSSTNPLIKTPYEQVTGVDTFTGRDISDRSPLQAMLDTTGLNNLTTKQIDKLSKLVDAGELNDETFANIFPSVFRINDSEKIRNQQQYEELMAYQEYIKQLKNQGIDVPTIKELTSQTNSSIKNIKKYRKRRSR